MKNKLVFLLVLLSSFATYSQQWTDITASIGGGISSTTNMSKPYIFDLNNDNYPDFLVPVLSSVTSPYTKYWKLEKNNGNGTFTDVTSSYGLPNNLSLNSLGFIDYNGDGFKDLYFYTATGLQIFKNNSGTSFTDVSTLLGTSSTFFTTGEITSSLKVFDYDLDGDEDLLYTRTVSGTNTLTAIVNNGSSFFTKVNILSSIPGATTGVMNFSIFDMDNDGDFDIVFDAFTSQYSNGITTLYRKDSSGYTNTTSSSGIVNGLPGEISTIDINQDGNLDIVKGGADCCTSPLYRVFIGNGAGVFTEQTTSYTISNGGYKYSPTIVDFDNDADFDFSWSSYTSTSVAPFRLYVNNGSNTFTENATTYGLNLGVTSGGVPIDDNGNGVWMDLDKDGDLDIVLNREGWGSTSITGNVWVKRNPSQGNYINIKLNGCGVNKSAIGAKIKLVVGADTKWLCYGNSPDGNPTNGTDTFHFGLGTATLINSITVYWPNNTTTVLNNVSGNQFLTIGGGAGGSSAPTGSTSQTLCSGSTIANLTATGTNIQWYSTSTGGTALATTTALVNGTIYYASQTVNGCESFMRLALTATISGVSAPTGSAIQYFCGESTIASFVVNGASIKWYTNSTGGKEIPLTTLITNGSIFYASSTDNNCESSTRLAIQGYVKNTSLIASSSIICSGASVSLSASDTTSTSTTYLWSTGGTTSSIIVSPENSTTYWVDIISHGNTCRKYITTIVNNAVLIASNISTCPGSLVNISVNEQKNSTNNSCSSSILPTNLQTNLLAWYPFCGNVNDQTANNNNGTVFGKTSYINDRYNNPSSAFFFDGASKIQIPHSNSLNAFPFSVSAWVKSSNIKPGHIIDKYENATWNGWALGAEPKGSGGYLINRTNAMISQYDDFPEFSTQPINDNSWHNLVFVVDQYSGRIYLDGILQDTQLWRGTPGVANSSWPMIIGYYAHTYASIGTESGYFNGASDDIGVWGRALTDVEVQQLYNSQNLITYLWSTGETTQSINPSPYQNTQYWVDVTTNGVTCRKYITITINSTTSAPTGNASQTLCSGSTVANLTATGTNIKWYATSAGGTALASTTALVNGTTYYASQTVNGCESTNRLAVTVTLNNPTVSATATTICGGSNVTITASLGAPTTSNFSVGSIGPAGGYVFYDQGSVINGWRYLEVMPYDVINTNNFGLGCYCNTIFNTSNTIESGFNNTVAWANSGCPTIASNFNYAGNSDWFIPSKDELNLMYSNLKINNLGNFQNLQYWSSSPASYGSCGINGGAWVQNFTNGTQNSEYRNGYQGSGNLRLVRKFSTGNNYLTYLWSTGETTQSINPSPNQTTQYWVDVTTNGVTCRKFITITVNSTTSAPTGSTSQTICSGSTIANLTATSTNIQWYATSTGGTALTSETALVNGATYYASQTVNGCESTSRLTVTVSLNNPVISSTASTICLGSSVSLTASDLNNSQQINNNVASFDTSYNKHITLSYPTQSIPTSNFSYDFWFNTSKTITLLNERSGGSSLYGGANNQNYAVLPTFQNQTMPFLRGTGVSVGTNGIVIIEHCPYFIDSRLTYSANLIGWHHCAVVYQNNGLSLFVDGVLVGSRTNGSNFGGNGTIFNNVGLMQDIGLGYNGRLGGASTDHYTGKLDEYQQWSTALSPTQISQIYNRKLQSINMAECNLNLTFDQGKIENNSIINSGLSLSNTTSPSFSTDNSFQIGGFIGTSIFNISNTNLTGTNSSTFVWSTGRTSQTIDVIPTQTSQYWVDVTTNGVTCRKYATVTVKSGQPCTPTGINSPAVAIAEQISVERGSSTSTLVGGSKSVLTNDIDLDNDKLTAILISNVSNGLLEFNTDGTFNYVHNGSATASDSFTYVVYDSLSYSNIATVIINVSSFTLPYNNFSIETKSESCANKNNGEISITTNQMYNYVAKINGTNYSFTNNSLVVPNLAPGTYSVCISVEGKIFEQCYTINIARGLILNGKYTFSNNKVAVEIMEGTAPYKIFVNGSPQFETDSPEFKVDAKQGDLLEVKTAKACEGIYSKSVLDSLEGAFVYPNPTHGKFEIALPGSENEVSIELYSMNSKLISKANYSIINHRVQLSLEKESAGVYIAKVYTVTPLNLTIIKK